MSEIVKMLDDPRDIIAIYWDDEDESQIKVGTGGITKIVAYAENGPYCELPTLAVYKGDEILTRIPAAKVSVQYSDKPPKG